MEQDPTYRLHLDELDRRLGRSLNELRSTGEDYEGVIFDAGVENTYHRDDEAVPFRTDPNFGRWAPVPGPGHLLLCHPGETPRLVRVVPRGFWYETPGALPHPLESVLEITECGSREQALAELGTRPGMAYVGSDRAAAQRLAIDPRAVEPAGLMARLDDDRVAKTPYEIECIHEACRTAARGHAAVRDGAADGLSERRLHALYLEATSQLEVDCPYTNIIGWDEHAAILHYQSKEIRPPRRGVSLLIDAGARHLGYHSDVTRTYARPGAPAEFTALLDGMDRLQQELVAGARAERPFLELHEDAHRAIGALLYEVGVLRVTGEQAFARGLTRPFFCHGLGHHLGLQTHDVGGHQVDRDGRIEPPPAQYPSLRTTRRLEPGHVLTIEPGLYFIPMLLDPLRESPDAEAIDWSLVEQLMPCGGIRIEDDVLVTEDVPQDLTRALIPGHRD
jgi:Xaa-Pro dipeptidase